MQCCGSASRWCVSRFDVSPWCGSGFLFDGDAHPGYGTKMMRIRIHNSNTGSVYSMLHLHVSRQITSVIFQMFFTVVRTQLLLCREWKPKVPHPDLVKMRDGSRYDRCVWTELRIMFCVNGVSKQGLRIWFRCKVPENRLAGSITVLTQRRELKVRVGTDV